MIHIEVNGQSKEMAPNSTISDLLEEMALTERRVAVEHNLEIVPRSQHSITALNQGDQIEIVHAIGGG